MHPCPNFFKQAKNLRLLSNHPQYHIGAAIFNKKRFIIGGFNSLKSHPISTPKTIHAEFHAILRASAIGFDLRGATIVVYREHKDGRPAMARPCQRCWNGIVECGIRRIIWTTNSGWEEEKI